MAWAYISKSDGETEVARGNLPCQRRVQYLITSFKLVRCDMEARIIWLSLPLKDIEQLRIPNVCHKVCVDGLHEKCSMYRIERPHNKDVNF